MLDKVDFFSALANSSRGFKGSMTENEFEFV